MLNVTRDLANRKEGEGQYYVELVNHTPFMGATNEKINRFGYWCDKGHLKHMILALIGQFTTYDLFAHLLEEPRKPIGSQSSQATSNRSDEIAFLESCIYRTKNKMVFLNNQDNDLELRINDRIAQLLAMR